MTEPTSMEEFSAKATANMKVSGFGILGVKQHMPCPACAEPDWLVFRVIDAQEAMGAGAVCEHCKRGFHVEYQRPGPGHLAFEFVQASGPPLPAWLVPQMRRVGE